MNTNASLNFPMPGDAQSRDAIDVHVIEDADSLAAVEAEWSRLWSRDPRATPFQSPAWLLPWWRHVGRGELMTFAARDRSSGELVGLLPAYVYRNDAGTRHLFPIGIATTDYLDVLGAPERGDAVALAILDRLSTLRDRWDVAEWPQLRGESPLLRAHVRASGQHETSAGEPNPVLTLDGRSLAQRLTPAMAENVRYCRRRLARSGTVDYEVAEERGIDAALDALVRLHTARWSSRSLDGVLRDAAVIASHRESAPRLHAAGLLRLLTLRLDGEAIAVLYALADAPSVASRRWYYYIGGFDPTRSTLSPGTLLIAHAIERAIAEGANAFDFLRGAEAYKYRWSAVDQPMFTLRCWPAGEAS